MQLIGIIICFSIIDRWGRRSTLLFSMVCVFVSLMTIGIGFLIDNGIVTVTGMFFYLFAFGVGLSTMPYTMNSEIYPTEYRGLCVAQATAVFWGTNFIVSLTFLTLANAMGNYGVFFLYAAVVFFSGFYFYSTVPETSGMSLHEIQAFFETADGSETDNLSEDIEEHTCDIEVSSRRVTNYGTEDVPSREDSKLPEIS